MAHDGERQPLLWALAAQSATEFTFLLQNLIHNKRKTLHRAMASWTRDRISHGGSCWLLMASTKRRLSDSISRGLSVAPCCKRWWRATINACDSVCNADTACTVLSTRIRGFPKKARTFARLPYTRQRQSANLSKLDLGDCSLDNKVRIQSMLGEYCPVSGLPDLPKDSYNQLQIKCWFLLQYCICYPFIYTSNCCDVDLNTYVRVWPYSFGPRIEQKKVFDRLRLVGLTYRTNRISTNSAPK